jgi:hypothetical protein
MMPYRFSFLLLAVTLASPAGAHDYLTEVTSQVYQVPGTPKEIAMRAQTCMAQNLRPGSVNAQQFVSSDPEHGVIVAQNALRFGSLPEWQARSRFTFEAREGRFRINQTGIEMFNDLAGGWRPIGKWTGSPWRKAEAAFTASADAVAHCVIAGAKGDVW